MILQQENNGMSVTSTVDHDPDVTVKQVTYERIYSLCTYPMQTMSKYGVIFPKVPMFMTTKSHSMLTWTISVLLVRVESLWKAVCAVMLAITAPSLLLQGSSYLITPVDQCHCV